MRNIFLETSFRNNTIHKQRNNKKVKKKTMKDEEKEG